LELIEAAKYFGEEFKNNLAVDGYDFTVIKVKFHLT